MAEIFHVYASHGRNNYVELDLPASGYEMLDMMERLRLEPGQLPYVEVLKVREEYDYLERCIHEQPDVYQLNALARKLSEFTSMQEMAAFEGLVGKEIGQKAVTIELPRLIDFAHSTEHCYVAEDAMTDYQLGKFLVENDFIVEANGLPDAALALLDYGKIGREHREQEGGVFTGFGYVEVYEDVRHVSETMDFQPRKPPYTVLVNMAAIPLAGGRIQKEDLLQLRLPTPEPQMREALEKLERQDWKDVAVSIVDSPIPGLNHTMHFDGEMPLILELSQRLTELVGRGELPKFKAILAANDCQEISRMISLAAEADEYFFEPQISSPEDVARSELSMVICGKDAETLLPHINLERYGLALLARDHAVVTSYGFIERDKTQQVQEEDHVPSQEGMMM